MRLFRFRRIARFLAIRLLVLLALNVLHVVTCINYLLEFKDWAAETCSPLPFRFEFFFTHIFIIFAASHFHDAADEKNYDAEANEVDLSPVRERDCTVQAAQLSLFDTLLLFVKVMAKPNLVVQEEKGLSRSGFASSC